MALRQRIWCALLSIGLAATCGCDVQDSEQPAVGSISVKASRDDDAPSLAPGKMRSKAKTAPVDHK